jgi:hypothetical protein
MAYEKINGLLIRPHERFPKQAGHPTGVIIVHHGSYFDAADALVECLGSKALEPDLNHPENLRDQRVLRYGGEPIILVNAREGSSAFNDGWWRSGVCQFRGIRWD